MKIVLIIILMALSGCASWTTHHDQVSWPDGSISKIQVSADGVVTAKKGDMEITSDHRGRPSVVEQVLGVAASSVTNVIKVDEVTK